MEEGNSHQVMDDERPKRLFVTVGSTKFVNLIAAVLSKKVVEALARATHARISLVIQYGATPLADILTAEDCVLTQATQTPHSELLGATGTFTSTLQPISSHSGSLSHALQEPETAMTFGQSEDASSSSRDTTSPSTTSSNRSRSHVKMHVPTSSGSVSIELVDYLDTLRPNLEEADVVLSHAGTSLLHAPYSTDGHQALALFSKLFDYPPRAVRSSSSSLMRH